MLAPDFPGLADSPYAAELRRGRVPIRFPEGLEAEFRAFHLGRAIRHVRMWHLLVFVLGALTAIGHSWVHDGFGTSDLLRWFVLVPLAAVIAWAAWSREYQRWYVPVATLALPVISVISTLLVAYVMADGNLAPIVYLTTSIFAAYLLTGALFCQGVALGLMIIGAFVAGALRATMPLEMLTYITSMLVTLAAMSTVVSYIMEQSSRRAFLEHGLLREMARRDGLTGLHNRRTLDEHLERTWMQGARDVGALTLLLIDLDDFKAYNDRFGHPAGDDALRRVSDVVRNASRRPLDLAARYGGEELAVVLYEADAAHARTVAEHIRREVEVLAIPHSGSSAAASVVTVSIGAATTLPTSQCGPEQLLHAADQALYLAKQDGRNRVRFMTLDDGGAKPGVVIFPGTRRRVG